MKRIIGIIEFILLPFLAFAIEGKFRSVAEAREYYLQNISRLDPIEGLYDASNTVVASSPGIGSIRNVQDFTWAIYYVSDSEDGSKLFAVQNFSGSDTGVMSIIERLGETPYYKLYRGDSRGNTHEERFELGSLFSFGYSYKYGLGNASSTVSLTAIKKYPTKSMYQESIRQAEESTKSKDWSGTGFALNNGYVVTNYHVVEGARSIVVHGVNGNRNSELTAEVVAIDKTNDLAIIKITDSAFVGFGEIPYAINNQMADVGEDVWVLGYPLTQVLGNEVKLTNGIISSRSGYQGDVSTYQISAPLQPGNSGGPLFDSQGNVVGIINAGIPGAENVGYAIKTTYLLNLAESYSLSSSLPKNNTVSSHVLKEQVKCVKDYVLLLMCSSNNSSKQPSPNQSITVSIPDSGNTSELIPNTKAIAETESELSIMPKDISVEPQIVDLGLSVKWADRNLGASFPNEYGAYFAWGEVTPRQDFSWKEYRFRESGENEKDIKLGKYNTKKKYGQVDNLVRLEGADDAASASWGGKWRMPTKVEFGELLEKCSWEWTTSYGINGYLVTGPNGNSIFLPAAGIRNVLGDTASNLWGYYWTSDLYPNLPYEAYGINYRRDLSAPDFHCGRYSGMTIRPVYD